jgi:diaminopimelate epimerase
MIPKGRSFFKMSGSGNDFVMIDARSDPAAELREPASVRAVCARGTGVGADGIVFLESSAQASVKLIYLNADGSLADLCGNATLCTARLAIELGMVDPSGFTIETGAGLVAARMGKEGKPEIDLQPVRDIEPDNVTITRERGEERLGFALAGVPHLTIAVSDVSTVELLSRGRSLRHHASLVAGANVNFVSPLGSGPWAMRTYERGVEGETLACGTGAVASAVLLAEWGLASMPVRIRTTSGRELRVNGRRDGSVWYASLSGSAEIVFVGSLGEVPGR